MGLSVVMEVSDFCLCVHPPTRLAIGFKDHDGATTGSFDPIRPGLDHLALAVDDVEELARWADHLSAFDVPFSPIQETDLGSHLNLRAPDEIAVELFVLKADAAGALFET
jgi:glyoxylase I family protein